MEKETRPLTFTVDPTDLEGLRKIMDEHGDSKFPFFGDNEQLEEVMISVAKERIDVTTYQHNGWVRRDVYWRDGTREELYEGKWK